MRRSTTDYSIARCGPNRRRCLVRWPIAKCLDANELGNSAWRQSGALATLPTARPEVGACASAASHGMGNERILLFLSLATQKTMATANRKSDFVILHCKIGLAAILLASLASGCTPYQKMRDQWATMANATAPPGLPPHPSAAVAQTAGGSAPSAATPEQPVSTAVGSSEHGEEITPFAVEKSSPGATTPDDSKLPMQAKIEPIPKDLLEEFLPAAQERSRGIDDRMAPVSAAAATKATTEPASAPAAIDSTVALSQASAQTSSAQNPPALDASASRQGPPAPPWQRQTSRQSAIQSYTQAVAARAAQTASASPTSDTQASSGDGDNIEPSASSTAAQVAAGSEPFDPFEGTDFALPATASTPAQNQQMATTSAKQPVIATRAESISSRSAPSMKTEPVAAKQAPKATASASHSQAPIQKAAGASTVSQTSASPARSASMSTSTSKVPASSPATTSRLAMQSAPSEFSASLGETLLSQASFSPTPTIAPLQLVAGASADPVTPVDPTTSQGDSANTSQAGERPATSVPEMPAPSTAKPLSAVKVTPASVKTMSSKRPRSQVTPSTPTDAVPSSSSETSVEVATPEPAGEPPADAPAEEANDGWQAVPVESADEWKGAK